MSSGTRHAGCRSYSLPGCCPAPGPGAVVAPIPSSSPSSSAVRPGGSGTESQDQQDGSTGGYDAEGGIEGMSAGSEVDTMA